MSHISNSLDHPYVIACAGGHQLPGHISCAEILPLDLWDLKAFEFFCKNAEVVKLLPLCSNSNFQDSAQCYQGSAQTQTPLGPNFLWRELHCYKNTANEEQKNTREPREFLPFFLPSIFQFAELLLLREKVYQQKFKERIEEQCLLLQ